MTTTIFYKGKLYNGIFVSTIGGFDDIYIDRQARLAILVDRNEEEVSAILKLENYQIDVLLDDEDEIDFLYELREIEKKFKKEMYD